VTPHEASRLVLSLGGAEGGAITLRIEAAIQPAPLIRIMNLDRTDMLRRGTYGVGSVRVRGEACSEFAITELIVNDAVVPVGGDLACEPFDVGVTSPYGMTIVDVRATNARGRSARRVQSFLRAPGYFAPPPAVPDEPAFDSATDVRYASFTRYSPQGWQKLSSLVPAVVNAHADSIGAAVPLEIADTWTGRSCFAGRVVRGYEVVRGAPDGAIPPNGVQLTVVDQNTLRTVINFDLTVPITVFVRSRSNCGPTTTITRHGTMTTTAGRAHGDIAFGIVPVIGGVDVALDDVGDMDLSGYALSIDLSSTGLTSTQIASLLASVRNAHDTYLPLGVARLLEKTADELAVPFETLAISPDGPALIGVDLLGRARAVALVNGGVSLILSGRAAPLARTSPIDPSRGAIRSRSPVPTSEDVASDVAHYVGDELTNQILWAAWQAGGFDIADLNGLVSLEGLALSAESHLPPVMTPRPNGRVRLSWGNVLLRGSADPAVFGVGPQASAEAVEVRAWASLRLDGVIRWDTAASGLRVTNPVVEVVVEFASPPTALLDEAAVRAAIAAAMHGVALDRLRAVVAALPVPHADYGLGTAGMSEGNHATTRAGPFQLVTATIQVLP